MNWNQPICEVCWSKREPDRAPFRLKYPDAQQCSFCGKFTNSGIFVRADPSTVPYPAKEEE